MSEPNSENDPWAVVGEQPVRMPERVPRRIAVSKIVGFVLLGLGGMAIAFFVFCVSAVRYGILNADNPNVPTVTANDVALTVASGLAGLSLITGGYRLFRGSFPRPDKPPV